MRKPRTPHITEIVHELIREQIQLHNQPIHESHWKTQTQKVTDTGHSLQDLHQLAENTIVAGKPFFGYGSWEAYLKKLTRKRLTRFSNEDLNVRVMELIRKGTEMSTAHWQSVRELQRLYYLVHQREIRGKSFMGQGSWKEYVAWLQRQHPTK